MRECARTMVGASLTSQVAVFVAMSLALPLALTAQGVAVAGRTARGSPLAKTDLPPPQIHFEDIAVEAGLDFRHVLGNPTDKRYILETTGGGAAIFDFDRDGLPDVFLVNGQRWAADAEQAPPTSRLFRNLGNLRFEDVTESAGLVRSGWGQGACVGDYDNDGYDDLLVTHYGPDRLYRNDKGRRFVDVTDATGLLTAGERWGTGCAFLDYDRDGWLDVVIAHYVALDLEQTPVPGESNFCRYKGIAVLCGPRGLPPETSQLWRNTGAGRFKDVSVPSGIADATERYALGVLTLDFDDDGWTDIYIAADSTPSMLFHNQRDGTFQDVGLLSGTALNENGKEQAGMGVAAADFNHDGRLDIAKTNFSDDVPSLYRNEGRGFFTDVSYRAGLGVDTNSVGWGVGWIDIDRDGWKDVFIVNGHVYPTIDTLESASRYRQPRLLYWNIRNGAFIDMSAQAGPAIVKRTAARGAAFGDLDNDGSVEVVVNNLDGRPNLLRNEAAGGNWIRIATRGTRSNRNGIGARIVVESGEIRQADEVRSGGSYMSHNDMRLHFGVGSAEEVRRVEVRWLSGLVESFGPFEVNRQVLLEEGQGAAP